MSYKILEIRIEFDKEQIDRITVLADYSLQSMPLTDVRAVFATRKIIGGYITIPSNAELTKTLIHAVTEQGCETVDRDIIFPGWKKKYTSKNSQTNLKL